jgi:hypothetical protein
MIALTRENVLYLSEEIVHSKANYSESKAKDILSWFVDDFFLRAALGL